MVFFVVADRLLLLIPNAIFDKILITLAKWPLQASELNGAMQHLTQDLSNSAVQHFSSSHIAKTSPPLTQAVREAVEELQGLEENLSSPCALIRGNSWDFF